MSCLNPIANFLERVDYSATSPRTMNNSVGNMGFAPMNLIKSSEDFASSGWTKTDTTVTSNAATAPDGTLTADKISHDDTTATITQTLTVVSGTDYRLGAFIKYIDHQWIRFYLDGDNVWFDVQNGVIGTDNTSSATMTALSDDWYYITADKTTSDTAFALDITLADGDNSGTETSGTSAYIWGAHLYENGLAGMFDVPEDQRALAALDKYLPNKAVVTGPNLVSNGTFDSSTAGWTAGASTSGTATVSWDAGTIDVDNDGGAASRGNAYQSFTCVVGSTYVVQAEVTQTNGGAIVFASTSTTGSGSVASATVATGSTGVVRFYFVATSTTHYVILQNDSVGATASSNFDNITVEEVDRNPSAARFLPRRENHEYIDGAWVKGLKVESEARTNLVADSSDFDSWSNVNLTSKTNNAAASPDGQTNAVAIVADATNGQHRLDLSISNSAGDGAVSVYVKANGYDYVRLRITSVSLTANLTNGAIENLTADEGAVEDVGNGWYRCSIADASLSGSDTLRINIENSSAANDFVGDTTSGLLIWQPQFEEALTPSSLIPTYGATRTRTAETWTQKEDEIIWPNTTYVNGTELVTNGTFDTDTDWTKGAGWTISGGVASCDGTQVANSDLEQAVSFTDGNPYEITFTVTRSAGTLYPKIGGTTGEGISSSGTYTQVIVAGSGANLEMRADVNFVGTIDNISVKEINPRALCVVMHGHMTYADEGLSSQAIFWQQETDANNGLFVVLDTSGAKDGRLNSIQEANGTLDTSPSPDNTYSPGINVPFKIASRHLDNALQGAADGTATTENTTPPGLPDLSDTQIEWFYDGDFHITFVGLGVEGNAGASSRIGSTHGEQTLITMTDGTQP